MSTHTPWDAQRAEIIRLRTALKSYERDPLITAAPDLLAALREMPDLIKDLDGGNPETNTGWASEEMLDLWQQARAAIAKAEGTS